jgi:hypothetical protein
MLKQYQFDKEELFSDSTQLLLTSSLTPCHQNVVCQFLILLPIDLC